MSDISKLSSGKNITLIVNNGPYKGKYFSIVEKINNTDISIIAPVEKGITVLLPVGIKIAVTFWDELCAYLFETVIKSREFGTVPTYQLAIPKNFIRIQRREYVRIFTVLPLSFKYAYPEDEANNEWKNAYTLDLSGGGMRFITKELVNTSSIIDIALELPKDDKINFRAEVLRVENTRDKKEKAVAVRFTEISVRDREKIIRYVFNLQRHLRKKGLV